MIIDLFIVLLMSLSLSGPSTANSSAEELDHITCLERSLMDSRWTTEDDFVDDRDSDSDSFVGSAMGSDDTIITLAGDDWEQVSPASVFLLKEQMATTLTDGGHSGSYFSSSAAESQSNVASLVTSAASSVASSMASLWRGWGRTSEK